MSRGKGSEGAYTFTRAAYDEMRDCEVGYAVKWSVTLGSSFQRGVWSLLIEVRPLSHLGGRPVVSYEATWPNSQAQTFEAFLYAAMHRTSRMVEAWATDGFKLDASRQGPSGRR